MPRISFSHFVHATLIANSALGTALPVQLVKQIGTLTVILGFAAPPSHPRQLQNVRDVHLGEDNDINDFDNVTLSRRSNNPARDRQWSNWVALGESFASGLGAGDSYDDSEAIRRKGSYPAQLNAFDAFLHGHGSPEFRFQACSGAKTTGAGCGAFGQADAVDGDTGLVTLSIGGNDIGQSTVLINCIFQGGLFADQRDNPCFDGNRLGTSQQDYFDHTGDSIFGTEFHNHFMSLAEKIIDRLQWSKEKGTAVYQTAYPQFFDDYTTQCSGIWFGPEPPLPGFPGSENEIYVDTPLRKNFNFLMQQMNCLEAYWIDQINHDHGDAESGTDIWKHANMDQRFNGHRFCRDGVEEPDRNNPEQSSTWFFNLYSNSESGGPTTFALTDDGDNGTAEQYADIDIETCGDGEDEWVQCMVAKAIADGYEGPYPNGDSGSVMKTFHPRIAGHSQTKEEVTQAVQYTRGASPSGKKLRILTLGDGLTLGTKSSEGSGYRKPLFDILQGNDVEFVGTQASGEAGSKWEKSEGYDDYRVGDINYELTHGSANGLNPNIIVIMAGSKDIREAGSWAELQDARIQIERLIGLARIITPQAFIIVAHVPAIGNNNFDSQISDVQRRAIQWNAYLNTIVNRERTAFPNRAILYAHTTPTTFDHADGDEVYLSDYGYDRIANDIAEAIAIGDSFGWIAEPANTAEAGSPVDHQGTCTAANECSIADTSLSCFNNYECAPELNTTTQPVPCSCFLLDDAGTEGGGGNSCNVPSGCTNVAAPDGCTILCT